MVLPNCRPSFRPFLIYCNFNTWSDFFLSFLFNWDWTCFLCMHFGQSRKKAQEMIKNTILKRFMQKKLYWESYHCLFGQFLIVIVLILGINGQSMFTFSMSDHCTVISTEDMSLKTYCYALFNIHVIFFFSSPEQTHMQYYNIKKKSFIS